jgi:uncharacterized membrane protein YfcA
MPSFLIPAFGVTALLYAAIGFGGGSTYTALLAISGTDYQLLPIISLCCNIIVVSGGTWRFAQAGAIDWRRIWPLFLLSIPAAWFGGQLPVGELAFTALLAGALGIAGLLILLQSKDAQDNHNIDNKPAKKRVLLNLAIGGGLGFLAGVTGIGGGIFLAPILYLIHWGPPRAIAGAASLFILLNSLAGLAGQFTNLNGDNGAALLSYWPLLLAVLLGGACGSWLGALRLPLNWLRRGTALLIILVSLRLFWRAITLL